MSKQIKTAKNLRNGFVELSFDDGTTDEIDGNTLIGIAILAKYPKLKYCKKVFDELECKMMPPTRDGRNYSGYNLFIASNKEKIQKKIQEELKQTGKRLLPPQVAGPIWKEDKRIQVLYNLAVQWVNAWNSLDDNHLFEIENVGDLN